MLMPKRVKHRKQFRGSMRGKASRGNKITYGEYGIVAMGTFVDSRSVSMIVEGILANTNADQTEKDYAQKIKDAILK